MEPFISSPRQLCKYQIWPESTAKGDAELWVTPVGKLRHRKAQGPTGAQQSILCTASLGFHPLHFPMPYLAFPEELKPEERSKVSVQQ